MNVFIIVLLGTLFLSSSCAKKQLQPPVARVEARELTIHGDTRTDNYFWLNNRENPEVITYLEAENAYTEAMLSHTGQFRESLYSEMIGRIKQTDESVPYRLNGYYYFNRFEEGQEYPVYSRKKDLPEAAEEIMLNVNELAKPYAYYAVNGLEVSPDNTLLAFAEDTLSRRKYTLRFKNLATSEMLPDQIPLTSGSVAWANDNKTIFYTKMDDQTLRSYKIMKHTLGTDSATDETVYEESDETFSCYVFTTKSQAYIMIGSFSTLTTEYRFIDAGKPQDRFKIVQPRERGLEYYADHFGDHFYIRTNLDAKNFKLIKTPVLKPEKKNWTDIIPHRPDVLLEANEIFNNFLVVQERQAGLTQLRVINWKSGDDHYLDFGEPAYTAGISTNPEFNSDVLRYSYSSLTTPNSTYDYNMFSHEKQLMKQQEVVGGYDPQEYVTERIMAPARDSVLVPVSLVYKKSLKKDRNPLLLYGYGSYGNSTNPYFSSVRLSLLDRGFIYAIAHIRGGEEMGRDWYENGKLLNKNNTFTDFIDCAEFLIEKGYTGKDQLFAMGGSAGGLLMGAIINMRPDLWKGVVAAVPFVDVVTTMLDESIPLTTAEYDEWGNPNDKIYYDYMLSYSPYDNVQAKAYPNLLVTTGLHDSQVQYWEPAKWVAKLRTMNTGPNRILLQTDMETGHGGASGRFKRFHEYALEYAFILDLMNIRK